MHFAENLIQIFITLFDEGGWVLYPIFGVSLIAWYIGFGKVLFLKKISKAHRVFMVQIDKNEQSRSAITSIGYGPLESLLNDLQFGEAQKSAQRMGNIFREFLATVVPDLEQGFSTMSACVSVAPLLGLLGTISGMNRMFSVITDVGLGSPSLMAGGISVALESALTGLTVAVASMFFYNFLVNKKDACIHRIVKDGQRIFSAVARFQTENANQGNVSDV